MRYPASIKNIIILLVLSIQVASAQADEKADSLMSVLQQVNGQDSIAVLSELAEHFARAGSIKFQGVIKELEQLVTRYQKPELQLEVWRFKCMVYVVQFQHDSLKITAKKGIASAIKFGNDYSLSNFYNYMGIYHGSFASIDSSIYYYHLGLKTEGANKLSFYSNLGNSYQRKRDYLSSIKYLDLAMEETKVAKNIYSEAIVSNNIAKVYSDIGNHEKAREYAERSISLMEQTGDERGKIFGRMAIANLDLPMEIIDEQLAIVKGMSQRAGDPIYNRLHHLAWAMLLTKKGESQQALDMLLPIYREAKESQSFELMGILDNLAVVNLALDRLSEAQKYAIEALEIALAQNNIDDIQRARGYLLQIYNKENSYQNYHTIAKEYYPMQDSIEKQESLNKLAFLNAKLEDAEQKQEIIVLNQTIRQKEVEQFWISVAIGLGVMLLLVFLYFRMREVKTQKAQLIKEKKTADELSQMNKKLQSLDEMKSQFFTNISHEFRTPLTIINGMMDLVKNKPNVWMEKGTQMIKSNATNLLNLVNQILDLRKLEAGSLQLNLAQGDVIQYLRYIAESHQIYAESEGLQLHFSSSESALTMDYDSEKLLQIISNLLSNAVKNTPSGQDIYFKLKVITNNEEPFLEIQIQDTGKGIPENELPYIFDRFYQVSDSNGLKSDNKVKGTGIGLALTKELVKLMRGDIEVNSELGKGTVFNVNLPVRKEAEKLVTKAHKHPTITLPSVTETDLLLNPLEASSEELPSLLLIEDNPDIRQYLIACLQDEYQLQIARNGQEGIDTAIEQVPDIIISDVMMPKKDGFEVVKTLKNDERTSHIPIIMLTAKTDDASRIQGLERGAEAYLSKPFNKEELLVRLRKLLEIRRKLQERYTASEISDKKSKQPSINEKLEDAFMLKLHNVMESNMSDENFGVKELCTELGMSRTQLHNKIKALTGKSTSLYFRSFRLQSARQLLFKTEKNVSEVAMDVGFKYLQHFSNYYFEEFGERPSKTRA